MTAEASAKVAKKRNQPDHESCHANDPIGVGRDTAGDDGRCSKSRKLNCNSSNRGPAGSRYNSLPEDVRCWSCGAHSYSRNRRQMEGACKIIKMPRSLSSGMELLIVTLRADDPELRP